MKSMPAIVRILIVAAATITTHGAQPQAYVTSPTQVTLSNAVFNGVVNPNGEATAAWFEWGITTNYGRFVTIANANGGFTNLWLEGNAPVNYDHATAIQAMGSGALLTGTGSLIEGLAAGTMYQYRLVASNRFGQVTGGHTWCPVPAPQVVVEPATAVTGSSAILHAQVNPNGWPVTAWFQWGINGIENRSAPIYLSPRTNAVPLSLYVTGLVPGVTYSYYQVMVTNGAYNTFAGWSFVTPIPPTVTTLSAAAVSHTNATLKGSVNPKSLPTRAWFEWGLSTNYVHRTSSVEVGAGNTNVPVAMTIGPLSSLATCHFRLVAENSGGVVNGPDATFTTLPPPVAANGYYVSRTLLPWGLSTPITITATGDKYFYQGAIPRTFRIRLTQNGQPFNLIEPESVWPKSLTFMFPPLDPGYYGFVIQAQMPLVGWGDFYESGPRFFKVERYVALQEGATRSFQLAARNSSLEQVNPTEFIPTATYTLSKVITGTISGRQHVNAGLKMPWTRDFWKSGENGVKLSFDFILDDYVMYKFEIPIVITFEFPTIVAQGQLVEAKAKSVSFPGGEWLRAEHNVYYSTDHNLWLNAPYDGLPPVDLSLSQKDDKLLIWGSVPTLPGCDAISFSVDSSAVPWILTPVGEGVLGNQDPFGDGEAEFGGVKNRLGGNVFWVNSGTTVESMNGWQDIWTGDWTRNSGLWYSGGDQILFLAGSSIPYVSQAAQLLTLARVKLFSAFELHVMSRDQISLAPFDLYLSTKIPWNAPTNYVVQGTFTNPFHFDLASHYMYRLGAGFKLVMPIIGDQNLGGWNGNDIYQSGPLWSPTYESNLVFTVNLPVTVLPTNAFKQKYLATADNSAVDYLRNYTVPEALEDQLRIADLIAKMHQGNVQPQPADSMISMGTFLPQPESAFALMLLSDSSIGGTIIADPPPVDGGYAAGTLVRLAASSGPGYKFTGWGGDAAGSANPVTVTMNDVKQVTARFETALPPVALVNPSFELDTFTKWPGYRDANGPITGWTTEAGMGLNPVAPYGTNDYPFADYGAVPHGRQAAFLQGEGALKQMVKRLTAGSKYRVEYRENARRAGYGGMITKDAPILEVRMGTNVIDAAHEVRPLSLYAQKASQPFVANGPEMELAFVKTGPVGLDRTLLIDDVRVVDLSPTSFPGPLKFFTDRLSVNENEGSAVISVMRLSGTGAASVSYRARGGSATAGQDYTAPAGTLQWADGELGPKTFTVSILNDSLPEAAETVLLELTDSIGAYISSPSLLVLTIVDDDQSAARWVLTLTPPGTGAIAAAPAPGADGKYAAGTVVTLSASPHFGYGFGSWSGAASGASPTTTVTMDSDKTVMANFNRDPAFLAGLRRQIYTNVIGITIADLIVSPKFPSAPDIVDSVPTFESQYLPNDTAENYGQRLSGWLVPPATGAYIFYLASDDAGQVFLSTDETPANKQLIAEETSWSPWRNWEGTTANPQRASGNITLTAGKFYYLEVLHKEGGGLDCLSVAWKLPGGSAPANGHDPVGGMCLVYLPEMPEPFFYTANVTVTPFGSGTINLSPPAQAYGKYASGTVVALMANPTRGYQFTGWSGAFSLAANPATLTVSSNTTVTALFGTVLPPAALVNPSFEADTFEVWAGGVEGNGPITGWSTFGSMGLNPVWPYNSTNYPYADNGAIPDGQQVAFMQSDGALKQVVKGLVVGGTYRVDYCENGRRWFDGATNDGPTVEVRMAGKVILPAHSVPPVGGGNPYTAKHSEPFMATATQMELAFEKTGPAGLDRTVLIDDVRVICLALPAQLSATLEKGSLILSWDPALSGSILETTESLLPPIQWAPVTGAANGQITVPVQGAARFYRLRQ